MIASMTADATDLDHEQALRALLHWYVEMGVDDAISDMPGVLALQPEPAAEAASQSQSQPRVRARARPIETETPPLAQDTAQTPPADEAIASAVSLAAACDSYEALEETVNNFNDCPLKAGAKNTVFADGVPGAPLLVIGEAPGRDEDRMGKPFVGRAGQLLDKMLAAIDMSRNENVLISNVIYWRPPGNRTPTPVEAAMCRPFVDRLIELTKPKVVLLAGGAPMQALLGITGIMRARGVWREISLPSGETVPALPIFHPAFLLRQPSNKRLAWQDLQSLKSRLMED